MVRLSGHRCIILTTAKPDNAQAAKGDAPGNNTAMSDASDWSGLNFWDTHTRANKALRPIAAKYKATPMTKPAPVPSASHPIPGTLTASAPATAPVTGDATADASKMFMVQPNH